MGFFYRTIRMVENGIKPAYVFDGKPPELKAGVVSTYAYLRFGRRIENCLQLSKRFEKREEAKEEGEEAKETGAAELICFFRLASNTITQALRRTWTASLVER